MPALTLISESMQAAVSTHNPRRSTKVTLKAVLLLSGVLTVVFLISFVFSEEGIAELRRSRERVDSLKADIARLEAENARLTREIESIKHSTFAVERIARQDLGMSKPGEVVYMLLPAGGGQGTGVRGQGPGAGAKPNSP